MKKYIPYTYLIGWSNLNWWYYGSEYGKAKKIANPCNLWTIYFTSSKEVAKIRTVYGEPDIIQVRHVFDNEKDCRLWESKVLQRLEVVYNPKWLNKSDYIAYDNKGKPKSIKHRQNISNGKRGIPQSERHKQRLSEVRKGIPKSMQFRQHLSQIEKGPGNPFYGKHHTEETKEKIRISLQKRKGDYTTDFLCSGA